MLLADFGESKQLTRTMSVRTVAGTPIYMAPEMREADEAKGPKVDVFSAGVLLAEMNSGRLPAPGPEVCCYSHTSRDTASEQDCWVCRHTKCRRRCARKGDGA